MVAWAEMEAVSLAEMEEVLVGSLVEAGINSDSIA